MSISLATGLGHGAAALIALTLGIGALILAVSSSGRIPQLPERVGRLMLIIALAILLAFHFFRPPVILRLYAPGAIPIVLTAAGVATLSAVVALVRPSRGQMLLGSITLGCGVLAWSITASASIRADVQADVILFQQHAADALLQRRDPYAITIPDLYPPDCPFFAPGMVRDGRVQEGYPYPPITLLLATIGRWLGDVRWPLVWVGALSAGMLAWVRPGARATASAAIFLFAAPAFFMIPLGYTDIYLACAMVASAFCAARCPRATPVMLGLLLATKQYAIVLLPAMLLLAPRPWTVLRIFRWFWPAIVISAALTLPPFLLHWNSTWHSMVMFHVHQSFRSDSLGYLPLLGPKWGPQLDTVAPLVAIVLAALLVWARTPRTPAGFCLASALLVTVFFAFGKQAFANYYFFAMACLCATIATDGLRQDILGKAPDSVDVAAGCFAGGPGAS